MAANICSRYFSCVRVDVKTMLPIARADRPALLLHAAQPIKLPAILAYFSLTRLNRKLVKIRMY